MDIRPTGNVAPASPGGSDKHVLADVRNIAAKPTVAPVDPTSVVQQPPPASGVAEVAQALQHINKSIRELSPNLEFTIDEDTDRTVVKIVDKQTNEVIRQLPSKEVLEIAKALDKLQGMLLKQQA